MRSVILSLLMTLAACSREESRESFDLTFVATTDDDAPLAGLYVRATLPDGRPQGLGATAGDGHLDTRINAPEGTPLELLAQCPSGYEAASNPSVLLTLRRFENMDHRGAARLRTVFQCRPLVRMAALVIRADGKAGLPVVLDGREIGQTGEGGVAHLLVTLPARGAFKLGLDTRAWPALRPKSPVATYIMRDADEIFVLDQPFEERVKRRKKALADPGPQRIESTGRREWTPPSR